MIVDNIKTFYKLNKPWRCYSSKELWKNHDDLVCSGLIKSVLSSCCGLRARWCNEGPGWLERLQLQRRSVLKESSHPSNTEFHLRLSSPGTQKAWVKQQQMWDVDLATVLLLIFDIRFSTLRSGEYIVREYFNFSSFTQHKLWSKWNFHLHCFYLLFKGPNVLRLAGFIWLIWWLQTLIGSSFEGRTLSWSMIPADTGVNLSKASCRLIVEDTCSSAQGQEGEIKWQIKLKTKKLKNLN